MRSTAARCPARMKATRSQVRSTSSKRCDERRIVAPRFFSCRTKSMKRFCMSGSRPLVGSSSKMTSGCVMNAHTRPTFCLVPFDILRMRRDGSSSKRSISSRMRAWSRCCFMRAMNARNPAPVMSSGQAISPGRYPKRFWMRARSRKQSMPSMVAIPLSGRMNPMRFLMVTVFPAPFGPRKPKTSPRSTENVTSNAPRPLP